MTTLRRHPLLLLFVLVFFSGLAFFARLAHSAPVVPDPTDHPIEFWESLATLRTSGGLYVVIAVAISAVAKSLARVLAPATGGSATGLRGRAISTLTAVALVAGALVDLLLGSLTGTGLAVAAAGALAMIQDPRDQLSKSPAASVASVALVLLLTLISLASCSGMQGQVRQRVANGVQIGLDCTAPALVAAAQEGAELARAAILSAIRDDGRPDATSLRAAGRALRKDALRCTFVAALASLAAPVPRASASEEPPQSLGIEVDGRALRSAGRELAATYWGVRGPILLPGGGSLDPDDDPDEGGQ